MVQTQVTAQGWLGSTPEGRRPQIRGWRAGGSLAVASSTPATPLLSPAKIRELNHARNRGAERTQLRGMARRATASAVNDLTERTCTGLDRAIESDEHPVNEPGLVRARHEPIRQAAHRLVRQGA